MKRIVPVFRDDTDKIFAVGTILTSMFFSFIPSLLVVLFGKKYMSESTCEIVKTVFNFELFLFLTSLICIIPILGWIISIILVPVILIINIIVMIINLCAIAENKEIKIPVFYPFL